MAHVAGLDPRGGLPAHSSSFQRRKGRVEPYKRTGRPAERGTTGIRAERNHGPDHRTRSCSGAGARRRPGGLRGRRSWPCAPGTRPDDLAGVGRGPSPESREGSRLRTRWSAPGRARPARRIRSTVRSTWFRELAWPPRRAPVPDRLTVDTTGTPKTTAAGRSSVDATAAGLVLAAGTVGDRVAQVLRRDAGAVPALQLAVGAAAERLVLAAGAVAGAVTGGGAGTASPGPPPGHPDLHPEAADHVHVRATALSTTSRAIEWASGRARYDMATPGARGPRTVATSSWRVNLSVAGAADAGRGPTTPPGRRVSTCRRR